MKQLSQNMRSGQLRIEDVPAPAVQPGRVLVQTAFSLISAGTERSLVETGRKSLVGKALSRPDQVQKVIRSFQQLGLQATYNLVKSRLDARMPLGYSASGVVIGVGAGITGLKAGDWVACAGASAGHAEMMSVPSNLCVRLPEGVNLHQAAFATVGAIALQGIRLADVRLGEVVLVIGLGLLGQLTVQMLKASGCIVVGYDLDPQRCELALRLGADHAVSVENGLEQVLATYTSAHGADAVIITAGTSSSRPVEMAGELCREKGRVVVVGAVGLTLPRAPYYNKEISFIISRSYGPGRYDATFEEKGLDYPYGYVRWTEQRNIAAFLQLLSTGKVDVEALVTHTFPLEQALTAYDLISGKGSEPFLGVLFEYSQALLAVERRVQVLPAAARPALPEGKVRIGVIGAGNFARSMLLPHLKSHPQAALVGVATLTPLESKDVAERFGFSFAASDPEEVLADENIQAVLIATRHDSHADLALRALRLGKAVHVEKPLALIPAQLDEIVAFYRQQQEHAQAAPDPAVRAPFLMVGFNRRFAPLVRQAVDFFADRSEPLAMTYRINAGYIPLDHWTQDLEQGGGRVLGEVCHFLDLLQCLAGARLSSIYARALPNQGRYQDDNIAITAGLADGSVGNILYVANGDKAHSKEYLEVFSAGRVAVLDDFRSLALFHGRKQVSRQGGKGHREEMLAWVDALRQGLPEPVPFEHSIYATRAAFAVLQSLSSGEPVNLDQ